MPNGLPIANGTLLVGITTWRASLETSKCTCPSNLPSCPLKTTLYAAMRSALDVIGSCLVRSWAVCIPPSTPCTAVLRLFESSKNLSRCTEIKLISWHALAPRMAVDASLTTKKSILNVSSVTGLVIDAFTCPKGCMFTPLYTRNFVFVGCRYWRGRSISFSLSTLHDAPLSNWKRVRRPFTPKCPNTVVCFSVLIVNNVSASSAVLKLDTNWNESSTSEPFVASTSPSSWAIQWTALLAWRQTFAKWFFPPHFKQLFPSAGHSCRWPCCA